MRAYFFRSSLARPLPQLRPHNNNSRSSNLQVCTPQVTTHKLPYNYYSLHPNFFKHPSSICQASCSVLSQVPAIFRYLSLPIVHLFDLCFHPRNPSKTNSFITDSQTSLPTFSTYYYPIPQFESMPPRRITRSTAKEPENMVNQTAQQSVASMFVRPTKRSIAELDDEAAPVKAQKESKRATKRNAIPENQTQSSSMVQNSASTQSYAEDVTTAAPRGRGRRKTGIPKDTREATSSVKRKQKSHLLRPRVRDAGRKLHFKMKNQRPLSLKVFLPSFSIYFLRDIHY